jgi:hypothetical protein
VTYRDQADGLMYPMDKLNADEQFVANFTWKPLLRPKNRRDFFYQEEKEKKEIKKLPLNPKKKKR